MSFQEAHTLEEHRDYLYQIVHLQLFFTHLWLEKHPEEKFSDVLRNRVDVYRKTDANPECLNPKTLHFDEEPWLSMERAAEEVYRKYQSDRAGFEREAFFAFKDSIDARCERDYLDKMGTAGYQCGSLRHELALSNEGTTLGFHIANAASPKSIFTDPGYLPECFRKLIAVAEKMGATRIGTSSWLNDNPKWQAQFPQEWMDNMGERNKNVQWHYGFWGQFISSRHTYNKRYGDILRATGEMPFYPRYAFCSLEAMKKKLDGNC